MTRSIVASESFSGVLADMPVNLHVVVRIQVSFRCSEELS